MLLPRKTSSIANCRIFPIPWLEKPVVILSFMFIHLIMPSKSRAIFQATSNEIFQVLHIDYCFNLYISNACSEAIMSHI